MYHSSAITSTGELYTGGANDEGQVLPSEAASNHSHNKQGEFLLSLTCVEPIFDLLQLLWVLLTDNQPTFAGDIRPRVVEELGTHRISMVSCGLYHTVCLTASGLALSFGGNESGQCGHSGQKHSRVFPKVVDFANRERGSALIKQVAAGDLFTVFLTTSGEVYTCGAGSYMGCEKYRNKSVPQAERIDSLLGSNAILIAAGDRHAFAVTSTGEIYGWGNGKNGQLGLGEDVFDFEGCHVQIPLRLSTGDLLNDGNIVGLAAGQSHSLFWTSQGRLLGCGSNKHGQLSSLSPRITTLCAITFHEELKYCVMAACGQNHSLVLCSEFTDDLNLGTRSANTNTKGMRILAFGSNNFGQVDGSSSTSLFRSPVDITSSIADSRFLYIAAGGDQSFALGVPADSSVPSSPGVTGSGLGSGLSDSFTTNWMKR